MVDEGRFRNQLPGILDLIFLTAAKWLKPEFFDPAAPESKYFLGGPREFYGVAAEMLERSFSNVLAPWRSP